MNSKVIVVVGPTASGKTSLGVAIAERLDGEVISADSMQIYKYMTIATAKPTAEETKAIPHHLIDFVKPSETFSVAKYKELCEEKIRDILLRGKTPIIVGGTGLYIDTVVNNTRFVDYEKSGIREELEKKAATLGANHLLDELRTVDPKTAEKLHLNDLKRIIRALELYYTTGTTMSEQVERSHDEKSEFDFVMIGLTSKDRQFLYDRINRRVDMMLEQGLIEEAKSFYSSAYSKTAKQAIGYKELKPYLDGECSLEEATEKLKMETRRYAKRQLTWFRRNEKIHWLNIDEESSDELLKKSLEIIENTQGE